MTISAAGPLAGARFDRRRRRRATVLAAAAALLLAVFLLCLRIGTVSVTLADLLAIAGRWLDLAPATAPAPRAETVFLSIRLPRVVLGVAVGMALGLSGAVLQGLFRNPLADPQIIGVSAGAALGAAATIVLGDRLDGAVPGALGPYLTAAAAFLGGVAVMLLVTRLARTGGETSVATLLLAGIAVNALAMAGIGLLVYVADDVQLRTITFWTLGSLGGATWVSTGPSLLLVAAACVLLLGLARPLNGYVLGEAEAVHLGIDIEALKRRAVVGSALAVGAAVAVAGVIGFVGLLVPHAVRLLLGPDHRGVLAGSMLLGPILLLAADLVSRTAVAPAELPIGLVTSLIGAPVFLWLLLWYARGRRA